jgi:hypothetical protein
MTMEKKEKGLSETKYRKRKRMKREIRRKRKYILSHLHACIVLKTNASQTTWLQSDD